jgi:hypothetical protein
VKSIYDPIETILGWACGAPPQVYPLSVEPSPNPSSHRGALSLLSSLQMWTLPLHLPYASSCPPKQPQRPPLRAKIKLPAVFFLYRSTILFLISYQQSNPGNLATIHTESGMARNCYSYIVIETQNHNRNLKAIIIFSFPLYDANSH